MATPVGIPDFRAIVLPVPRPPPVFSSFSTSFLEINHYTGKKKDRRIADGDGRIDRLYGFTDTLLQCWSLLFFGVFGFFCLYFSHTPSAEPMLPYHCPDDHALRRHMHLIHPQYA